MKAILVTCPHCGANLSVRGASDEVTCEYCGTAARVQRRTRMFQTVLPPPPVAPQRPQMVAVQHRNSGILVFAIVMIMLPFVITGIIFYVVTSKATNMAQNAMSNAQALEKDARATAAAARAKAESSEWQGTDGILLVDLDHDGTADVVGRERHIQHGDQVRVVALDGKTGAKKWESEQLGSYSDTYQGKLAVAGDLALFTSQRGQITAIELTGPSAGKTRWTTTLDERVAALCEGTSSTVIAVGTDDVERPLRRDDGKPASATDKSIGDSLAESAVSPTAPKPKPKPLKRGTVTCKTLPSDDRTRHRHHPEDDKIANKHGIWTGAVVSGPGGRVVVGVRDKGTQVPTIVALDDKGEARWKIAIPKDPLGAQERAPEAAAVGDKQVCATYYVASGGQPASVACFALADGTRLWDEKTTEHAMRALVFDGTSLYVATVGKLVQRDAATGAVRWQFP